MDRPCLVTTPSRRHVAMIASFLSGPVAMLDIAQDHCPAELVAAAADRIGAADGLVAVGGGAAIGLGKALADRTGLPLIAIATTFAGSALTDSYGVTDHGEKRVVRSDQARPAISIQDGDLFEGLESPVAVASGMNAMAHAVEALARPEASQTHELAASAMEKLDAALLRAQVIDIDLAVEGALEAARCLAANGPGLHHRMCHYLGGRYGAPHAATHARLLPASVALHTTQSPQFAEAVQRALGGSGRLQQALTDAGLGGGLRALDIPPDAVGALTRLAVDAGHSADVAEIRLRQGYLGG